MFGAVVEAAQHFDGRLFPVSGTRKATAAGAVTKERISHEMRYPPHELRQAG